MIDCADFYSALVNQGVRFFTGIPDSLLAEFCEYVDQNTDRNNHVIAANEGTAVAMAIGHYLKSNTPSVVYLQNSGMDNTVNPLMSLADQAVYSIPMLLLVGWRGEPGVADEPQHVKQGAISEDLFRALGIDYFVMDCDSDYQAMLRDAFEIMSAGQKPCAILVRKQTFDKVEKKKKRQERSLSRERAIQVIASALSPEDVIVSTTGKASRELFETRVGKGEICADFLTVGGMGHASSIALGVKLAGHKGRVICLDGDGAFLMHMGAAATLASTGVSDFLHVVLDNGCHESVGGQPTVSDSIDFSALSKSLGYKNYYRADSEEQLITIMSETETLSSLSMVHVMVAASARCDLGRPSSTPSENKVAFMDKLV